MIRDARQPATLPLVSAIIPTYNRAKVVTDAIDSILHQTYGRVELIVVDDGSTDETQEVLGKYGDRIIVIRQENAGPSAARNRGIAAAHGEFVGFLDSDDVWLPTKLEKQVALLTKCDESVPCCLCNIMMNWSDGGRSSFDIAWLSIEQPEGIWTNVSEVVATRFVLLNQGVLIRRSALQRLGGFDESLRYLEDHDLTLRMSLLGPWGILREPLVIWRETKGSCYKVATAQRSSLETAPWIEILERQLARVPKDGEYSKLRRHLTREVKRARRHYRGERLSQSPSFAGMLAGKLLLKLEKYRSSVFRRSPWFPTVQIEAAK
ncbi:MAG: glycosyltransferase [Acidobacteria bacterium]|nr:glycosyltransferase [Acidobacteriota bacterium]